MSGTDKLKAIHKQCQTVNRLIKKAEKAKDPVSAEKFYRKAWKQMDVVTDSVKTSLSHMSMSTV